MATSKELTEAAASVALEGEVIPGGEALSAQPAANARDVNLPASLEAARVEIMALEKLTEIKSEDDFRVGELALVEIAKFAARVETTRVARAAPVNQEKQAIQDLYMPVINAAKGLRSRLEGNMVAFRRAEAEARQRVEREAAAAREAEAEAKRREADEALRAGNIEAAQTAHLEAFEISAPMIPSRGAITPSAGISARKRWVVEAGDVDRVALIRAAAANPEAYAAFLEPNYTALRQRAQQEADAFAVPGVTPRQLEGLAVRGG